MIVNISQSASAYDETLNVLRFSAIAQKVSIYTELSLNSCGKLYLLCHHTVWEWERVRVRVMFLLPDLYGVKYTMKIADTPCKCYSNYVTTRISAHPEQMLRLLA